MGLDEAVFYFGFLPSGTKKLLCMKKAVFRGKQETLAEYYVRAHGHLLEDVSVIEISDDGTIKIIIYLRRGRRISPRQTGSQSLEVLHGNMYPLSENGICIYLM